MILKRPATTDLRLKANEKLKQIRYFAAKAKVDESR